MVIGDRLGLYQALAEGGPITPGELVVRTPFRCPRATALSVSWSAFLPKWLQWDSASGYVGGA